MLFKKNIFVRDFKQSNLVNFNISFSDFGHFVIFIIIF